MTATVHAYTEVSASFGASPRTSGSFTAPTAGRTFLVVAAVSGGNDLSTMSPSLSDSAGNTYVLDTYLQVGSGTAVSTSAVFRCQSITGAPTTWTLTFTGASVIVYFFGIEVSGLAASPYLRVSSSATAYGTDSSTSYTTTEASELAFGRLLSGGSAFSGVGGMTVQDDVASTSSNSLYNADLSTAGSKTLGATWTTAQTWKQQLAFYSSGALAGGATIINMM